MPKAKNPVKSTKKTVRIIEKLEELDGATITELDDHLDTLKSSTHNYRSTLDEVEHVVEEEDETYHVGLRFLEAGSSARHRRQIYEAARPEVTELAEETGELANLLVEEHGRGVYIYRASGERAVEIDSFTGQRVYLHNTALGEAIPSRLPREQVEAIIDRHGLPAETDRTITGREELFDGLQEIRERGIAFDREERLRGLRCVAAPVASRTGNVEGAISVAGPTSPISGERLEEELPERIQNVTNINELNITYSREAGGRVGQWVNGRRQWFGTSGEPADGFTDPDCPVTCTQRTARIAVIVNVSPAIHRQLTRYRTVVSSE